MEKERKVESRIEKSSLLSFSGREGTNWQKRWVAREKVSVEVQIITRSVDTVTLNCQSTSNHQYRTCNSEQVYAFKPPKLQDSQMNTFWDSQTSWLPGWGNLSLGISNSKSVKAWCSKLLVKSIWIISKMVHFGPKLAKHGRLVNAQKGSERVQKGPKWST